MQRMVKKTDIFKPCERKTESCRGYCNFQGVDNLERKQEQIHNVTVTRD